MTNRFEPDQRVVCTQNDTGCELVRRGFVGTVSEYIGTGLFKLKELGASHFVFDEVRFEPHEELKEGDRVTYPDGEARIGQLKPEHGVADLYLDDGISFTTVALHLLAKVEKPKSLEGEIEAAVKEAMVPANHARTSTFHAERLIGRILGIVERHRSSAADTTKGT